MRRYISAWLLVGLVCGLAAGVCIAAVLHSAPRSSRPLASLVIGQGAQRVTLPGRALTCADAPPAGAVADCSVALEASLLRVAVSGSRQSGSLTGCAAEYAGRVRACAASLIYAPDPAPSVVIDDSLGLSAAQIDALRQRYALTQYTEADWLRIALWLAVLLGLASLGALWARVRPRTLSSRALVVGGSAALTGILAVALQIGLLVLGYID